MNKKQLTYLKISIVIIINIIMNLIKFCIKLYRIVIAVTI